MIIESDKLSQCIEYILDGKGTRTIIINPYQGYEIDNIVFLNVLSDVLEGIYMPDTRYDISIVNKMSKLCFLGFADNKKHTIDLSNFPALKSLACEDSPRLLNLEKCKNLTSLSITNYKKNNLEFISDSLNCLECLSIYCSKMESLDGIAKLNYLHDLDLFSLSKLQRIDGINQIKLKKIEIQKCRSILSYDL